MISVNFQIAWLGILAGMIVGAVLGSRFFDENWAGGYDSWRRRLMRLGHVAFLGTALINLLYALSVSQLDLVPSSSVASVLLVIGAIAMPLVCFLAAWRKPLRHLFFIPVLSLAGGVAIFVVKEVFR